MDIARILKENSIVPRREYDQFFLKDENVLREEVALAQLKKEDVVLEIGAGPGNLTEHITKKCKVIAIEKDYAFRGLLKSLPNTNVIFGDALEILESLRKAREQKGTPAQFNKVVSNVPYSITQDLIIELLKHSWSIAVLVVQKEFADKLEEKEKIALVVEDCCEIKNAGKVPAKSFYPEAVDSSIIMLRQKRLLDEGFWQFLDVYKNRNKNAGKVFKTLKGPAAKKKVHQLTLNELKEIYAGGK